MMLRNDFSDKKNGFTLFELIVALAIMAILGVVALKFYRDYTRTSFETDVVQALLGAKVAQEQYRAEHGTYATVIEDLPGFDDGNRDNSFIIHPGVTDARRRIIVRISSADNNGYTLVAENATTDRRWHLEWRLSCSTTDPYSTCTPQQTAGTSILRKLF